MNNGFNNNNNSTSTGTNGKFDFFPPDNSMNGNNQGMQQNNSVSMGLNQNMNFGNANGGGMQNTYTGVDYMNSGNNAMNDVGMNNGGQMNGMQGEMVQQNMPQQNMSQQGMQQPGMPQMGMNQPNMMQPNAPQPGMPQPTQMGFGNQPGSPKKGNNKSKLTLVVAVVVAIVTLFVLNMNRGNKLTCTAEEKKDDVKISTKMEMKVSKGGKKAVLKTEVKYEFDKLEDEDVVKVFEQIDVYGGGKTSPNYDKFDVKGTSEIGTTFLGENTVIKRKGNTVIVTAESSGDEEDEKIEKEDIEELKKSLEDGGMTCK